MGTYAGLPLRADTLQEILRELASNAPRHMRDQRQAWGFNYAGRLIGEVRGGPLEADLWRTLKNMLSSSNPDEVYLAATFLPTAQLDAQALESALARGFDEETQAAILAKLTRLLVAGKAAYSTDLRERVGTYGWELLIPVFAACDRAWFLKNLTLLLGDKPMEARRRLASTMRFFTAEEARALRADLDARRGSLGDRIVDELLRCIDHYLTNGGLRPG